MVFYFCRSVFSQGEPDVSSHNAVHVEYDLTHTHTHTHCQYTRQKALELRLVGWVKNTERSTVVGVVQGEERQVEAM